MVEDAKALEEVVVVGYTTQRKATITGSVATITTKDLKQSPTANLTNALAGRMPGLMANQFSGGEPGVASAEPLHMETRHRSSSLTVWNAMIWLI